MQLRSEVTRRGTMRRGCGRLMTEPATNAPLDHVVRFGAFELDLRTGELRKAGVRVNLPEQPYQVLRTLLDRPGDLVTREELRQRLWPAETFVDFEHGLNAAVRRLRDALGDSADSPRFVETLPRRGYRFIAPVSRNGVAPFLTLAAPSAPDQPTLAPAIEDARDTPSTSESIPGPPSRISVRGLVAASILLSVLVLGASGYLLWRSPASASTRSTTRFMLAVLPFENLTGDPEQEYISDGMTEELNAQLGGMNPSRLGVIARQSAMQFKKTTKRADQIGSDLGVSHLLEGSLRKNGGRIRIAVKLIDTESESQLWAEQYERDAQDLLTLQREVAAAVTSRITATLGVTAPNVTAGVRRHSTIAEAYDQYLRGRHHLWQRDTPEGFAKAREHFQRAIDLDASYAHAYSGLSDTYSMLGSVGLLPMREAYSLARAAALKALDLDDTLAEAHTSLAFILADYDWDWDAADRHFRLAVELNPNYETAVRTYPSYLSWWGRHEEALVFAGRARDLDPVSPNARHNLGLAHYFAGRYDDAITQFREALDLDPNFGGAHVMLGRTYAAKGLPDRAVEELELAKGLMGSRPDVITPMAYVLAKAGRRREALATLDELRRIAKPRDPSPFRIAYVNIGLGETDVAFEYLNKAIDARDWQMAMLKVEPAFEGLRSDPRFAALLQRVGLPR
jgi:TolB-like protein/DNA-binding winged helix-turn-helix (wHTH) protein/Flp pilus assembly protein TadD